MRARARKISSFGKVGIRKICVMARLKALDK
jgi:hypothetical protein